MAVPSRAYQIMIDGYFRDNVVCSDFFLNELLNYPVRRVGIFASTNNGKITTVIGKIYVIMLTIRRYESHLIMQMCNLHRCKAQCYNDVTAAPSNDVE